MAEPNKLRGDTHLFGELKIGDIDNGNYTKFAQDGSMESVGNAIVWDDLQVNINSLPLVGARSAERVIFKTDGVVPTEYAMDFDGDSAYGDVAYYSGMDTANLTIAMWCNADTITQNELLDRNTNGGFELYVNNGNLTFLPSGSSSVSVNNVIIAGTTQFIVATVKEEGSNVRCKLYVDGNSVAEQVINASLYQGNAGYKVAEWHNGGWNYDGRIDNLQTYNLVLTDAQILELYNNGEGTNDLPTGINEATDLIMYFKNNLTNQSTMVNATDFTNYGGVIVDGLVGISTGSFGVTALKFSKDTLNEIFFTAQLPHKYKEESDIEPHIHWALKALGGNVYMGMEFVWSEVNGAINNTTIIGSELTPSAINKHMVDNIAVLSGVGKGISSILQCRLFRNPDNVLDTLDEDMYLMGFDFHYKIDMIGSKNTWTK